MNFTSKYMWLSLLLLVWTSLQTVTGQNRDFWNDKGFLNHPNSSRPDTTRNVGITQRPLLPTQQPHMQMNMHQPQIPPPPPFPPLPMLAFKHQPFRWQLPAPPSEFHSFQERSQTNSSPNSNNADRSMFHSSIQHNGEMQSNSNEPVQPMQGNLGVRTLQHNNLFTTAAPKSASMTMSNNGAQSSNKDNSNLFSSGLMQGSASNYRLNANALPLIALPPPSLPPISRSMAEFLTLNNMTGGNSESSSNSAVFVNQQSPFGKRLNEMLLQNRLHQLQQQQQAQQTLLQMHHHSPLAHSLHHLTLPTIQSNKQLPNRMQEDYDEDEEAVSQNSLSSGRSLNAGNSATIHLSTGGGDNRVATTESNDNDLNNEVDQDGEEDANGGNSAANDDHKKRSQLTDSMNLLMFGRIPSINGGSPSYPILSTTNGGGFQPSILLKPTQKSPSNGLQSFTISPSIMPLSPLMPGSLASLSSSSMLGSSGNNSPAGSGQFAASQPVYYLIMPPSLGNGLLDDSLDIGDALTSGPVPSGPHKRRRQQPNQNSKQQNKPGAWWHRLLPERIRNNLSQNSKENANNHNNGNNGNNNAVSNESGENGGISASSMAATGPTAQFPFTFTAAELQGAGALRKPVLNYPTMPLYARPPIGLETNLLPELYAHQQAVGAQMASQPLLTHAGQHFYQPAFFAPMDDQHAVGTGGEEEDDDDDNGSNGGEEGNGNNQNGSKPRPPNRLVDRMRNWWKNIFRRPEAHGRPDSGGGGNNGGSHSPSQPQLPALSMNGVSAISNRLLLVTPNE